MAGVAGSKSQERTAAMVAWRLERRGWERQGRLMERRWPVVRVRGLEEDLAGLRGKEMERAKVGAIARFGGGDVMVRARGAYIGVGWMGACGWVGGIIGVGRRDRIREARGRGRWCRASNDSWINVHVYVLLASPISIPNQTAQPDYTHNTGYINFNMHRFLLSGRLQQTSGRPARAEACTMRVPWPEVQFHTTGCSIKHFKDKVYTYSGVYIPVSTPTNSRSAG